jgi:predicted lipid-binding transport protein (Tim44 family)
MFTKAALGSMLNGSLVGFLASLSFGLGFETVFCIFLVLIGNYLIQTGEY